MPTLHAICCRIVVALPMIGAVPGIERARVIELKSFHALGDGIADDSTAIVQWLATLTPGTIGKVEAGLYNFSVPLAILKPKVAIIGDAAYQTVFRYTGKPTSQDIFSVGDGKSPIWNTEIKGIRLTSQTKMTAGSMLHLQKVVRSIFEDIIIDGQDGAGNLWDGVWFDSIDFVRFEGFDARAQHEAFRINGALNHGAGADLFLRGGKVSGSSLALHVGGAFGGLYVDQFESVKNGHDLLVDTAIVDEGNRELFFGPTTTFDSAAEDSVLVNERKPNGGVFIQFSGTWMASGEKNGIHIAKDANCFVLYQGGTVFNFAQDGLVNESEKGRLFLNGTLFRENHQTAVASIKNSDRTQHATFFGNRSGDFRLLLATGGK